MHREATLHRQNPSVSCARLKGKKNSVFATFSKEKKNSICQVPVIAEHQRTTPKDEEHRTVI